MGQRVCTSWTRGGFWLQAAWQTADWMHLVGGWGYGEMAVGQNPWCHFGVGAPPILVYFNGDWDVHWKYDLDFAPWPNVREGPAFEGRLPNLDSLFLARQSPPGPFPVSPLCYVGAEGLSAPRPTRGLFSARTTAGRRRRLEGLQVPGS